MQNYVDHPETHRFGRPRSTNRASTGSVAAAKPWKTSPTRTTAHRFTLLLDGLITRSSAQSANLSTARPSVRLTPRVVGWSPHRAVDLAQLRLVRTVACVHRRQPVRGEHRSKRRGTDQQPFRQGLHPALRNDAETPTALRSLKPAFADLVLRVRARQQSFCLKLRYRAPAICCSGWAIAHANPPCQ